MTRVCIINAVGLTPELAQHGTNLSKLAQPQPFKSPLPAVTCTSQATMLTGLPPSEHGVVGNGWYYRDTQEIRFWQQANSLINGPKFYESVETAKLFWWFNQSAPVRWSATPKPHYGSDGSKVFDILDHTGCDLVRKLGPFPFFTFWGPNAGLPCSEWISKAAAIVLRENKPQLTMVYLPHLDYDYQRFEHHDLERVKELDTCIGNIVAGAQEIDAKVIVVSEYGLVPVSKPVMINQHLRREGWLTVRDGPFGEMLMPGESKAFAVVDHQLAHVYVNDQRDMANVRSSLESLDGIDSVVDPNDIGLGHSRSGEWIALAKPDAWFAYYYWLDDALAPDFARTVDIHRKPGYDPCELFITSKAKAIARVAQKKLGFRYRMDVIPLDPQLVKGSHGLRPNPQQGPVILGPGSPPDDMLGFSSYVTDLLN